MGDFLGKVVFLGGDDRMEVAARCLRTRGWHTVEWGTSEKNTNECEWQEVVSCADVIILPLPASSDGVRIHMPKVADAALRFHSLLREVRKDCVILGGRISPVWKQQAEAENVRLEDYYSFETLQMKNALPTAEGAICLAMNALPVTISGSHFSVIGYGRIASLLAEKLHALGAIVTVYARKPRDLAHAELRGLRTVCLPDVCTENTVLSFDPACRMVFNTVPVRVLKEPTLQSLPNACILMELASLPGGFDPLIADKLGINWILASALPGKCFPESAGRILAEVFNERLQELWQNRGYATERNDRLC